MSHTYKALQVLRLYDEQHQLLRAADIAQSLQISKATAYRCIEDLECAGLLACVGGGLYSLGPAIIEMDRRIRATDPLVEAASDVARTLSEATHSAIVLCRPYGLKVICIHSVACQATPAASGYERGRTMSLYRGAPSCAIFAHLPARTLRRIIDEDAGELGEAGWPTRRSDLQQRLQALRLQRVQRSLDGADARAHSWAVPLFLRQRLMGSLSVVRESAGLPAEEQARIGARLEQSALRVEANLEAIVCNRRCLARAGASTIAND